MRKPWGNHGETMGETMEVWISWHLLVDYVDFGWRNLIFDGFWWIRWVEWCVLDEFCGGWGGFKPEIWAYIWVWVLSDFVSKAWWSVTSKQIGTTISKRRFSVIEQNLELLLIPVSVDLLSPQRARLLTNEEHHWGQVSEICQVDGANTIYYILSMYIESKICEFISKLSVVWDGSGDGPGLWFEACENGITSLDHGGIPFFLPVKSHEIIETNFLVVEVTNC